MAGDYILAVQLIFLICEWSFFLLTFKLFWNIRATTKAFASEWLECLCELKKTGCRRCFYIFEVIIKKILPFNYFIWLSFGLIGAVIFAEIGVRMESCVLVWGVQWDNMAMFHHRSYLATACILVCLRLLGMLFRQAHCSLSTISLGNAYVAFPYHVCLVW